MRFFSQVCFFIISAAVHLFCLPALAETTTTHWSNFQLSYKEPPANEVEKSELKELLDQTARLNRVALNLLQSSGYPSVNCQESHRVPLFIWTGNATMRTLFPEVKDGDWFVGGVLEDPGILSKLILPGDIILEINGKAVRGSVQDPSILHVVNSVSLKLQRGTQVLSVTVPVFKTFCDLIFLVKPSKQINAWAQRPKGIIFTSEMMRFVNNDHELAVVIGHEIAHHNLGHTRIYSKKNVAKDMLGLTATLGALFLGVTADVDNPADLARAANGVVTAPFSKSDEIAADRDGVGLVTRSRYDAQAGVEYYRVTAMERNYTNQYNFTHPTSWDRYHRAKGQLRPNSGNA